jgi:ABC-type amino acid transport substrate-binding protein
LTCDIVQAIFPKGKHKDFKGQRSLEGKKVAWMREFKLDKYFKVKTKFREVNNRQSGFNLLNAGKIDFWIDPAVLLEPDWKNLTVKKEDYEKPMMSSIFPCAWPSPIRPRERNSPNCGTHEWWFSTNRAR